MTSEELRAAMRAFMKRRDLTPSGWGHAAGLSRSFVAEFLKGERPGTKTISFETMDKLAKAAGGTIFDIIGTGPRKPSGMVAVKWLKLEPQFGGTALAQIDPDETPMLLPRGLVEDHAFGEPARVRVIRIRESVDDIVRVGDIAAIDLERNDPHRESGRYYVWDGHAASVHHVPLPLSTARSGAVAEGAGFTKALHGMQYIGRVFWRCGEV